MSALFQPLPVGRLTLPNRWAVAPMTRVSATADGLATPQMAGYYTSFAQGGFGLVITEGTYTDKAYSQGYLFQPGLADSAQRDAWRPVVDGVHAHGSRIVAQLMHAGALSQGNAHRAATKAPSSVQPVGRQMPFYRGQGPYRRPEAMTHDDIAQAIEGFASAALRAKEAGFDGVELHGANGYLLDQFMNAHTNLRDDRYGGDQQHRLTLMAEVVEAVRRAVGRDFVVGVRISQGKVNDKAYKWPGGTADAQIIFGMLARLPIDYVHSTEFEAWQPAFAESDSSLAALARELVSVPVLANGSLQEGSHAAEMLAACQADFVSLGRGALTHADWPRRVRAGDALEAFDPGLLMPIADLENARKTRPQRLAGQASEGCGGAAG